ncbi:MAG: hypothetical protein ACXWVA_02505 [Rhodoplanes sp.]
MHSDPTKPARPSRRLAPVRCLFGAQAASALVIACCMLAPPPPAIGQSAPASAQGVATVDRTWSPPAVGALPNDAYGQAVRRGRDLDLHVDGARLDALERHRRHPLDHGPPPTRRVMLAESACAGKNV